MTVIFGGTGSLGNALVKRILSQLPDHEIHIVSRDPDKQTRMRRKYPGLHFHLGDVTDPYSLPHIPNPGAVFNLAAMKHVERGQKNHEFCVNVNYNGVINTYSWAHTHNATSYSQSSTDKAVEPINTYGKAKALAEDYLISRHPKFPISIFNWGNVLCSSGSVVHRFIQSLTKSQKVSITDDRMTRFFVELPDVAAFMWKNHANRGYHIPQMRSATIISVAEACAAYLGIDTFTVEYIGNRGGEKIHEKLGDMTSYDVPRYTQEELVEMIRRALD